MSMLTAPAHHLSSVMVGKVNLKQGSGAVLPDFAKVYSFIGSVFDPGTSGHLQKLKQMDPINLETLLLPAPPASIGSTEAAI
ncbi:hypothetical protein ERO13_A09G200952v2 [Gossypium hirsutum]|nr:hypothetical protein ERO13_A09G200952v2 [Gossypium hirsutum]